MLRRPLVSFRYTIDKLGYYLPCCPDCEYSYSDAYFSYLQLVFINWRRRIARYLFSRGLYKQYIHRAGYRLTLYYFFYIAYSKWFNRCCDLLLSNTVNYIRL